MSYDNQHDWLSLIEISGPFLAVPVLKESFPQGLEELDATKRKRLRQAYDEWREALELEDIQFSELHTAWIDEVLSRGLEFDEDGNGDVLKRANWCSANLQANLPEHGVVLSPDLAVVDEQHANKPLLLIQTYTPDVDLDATFKKDGWVTTPAERMVLLCRSIGCRLGLVTNGERWMLVDAPVGAVTSFASWYARIWSQESITLKAFVHLLGIRRFFLDASEQLPALFDRSLKFQDEVTDALGEQVRRAVEVLIQTLDKADQDRNRELLHDVTEPELYEAALTVMMRLVFLLSAEERGLLLMGDERYEANYALSTLRMQLRKESDDILERRWDAWSRLLAVFRAVFGGIEHENLRLPALGGSLFNPDRFPFLEGKTKGSNWRSESAKPLPIDNRTVLLLLEAIQQYQGRTLSYRALDVEQIGYVYEGLLERTVKRTEEVMLELDATKSAKMPWVKLAELDSARLDGPSQIATLLQERSGSSASRVKNDLTKPIDDSLADRLLTACQGDTKLRDRIKPYAHLLRTDPWGYPLVYPAGAFVVTSGSDRRESGTHYTPKSLTEAIVTETLTPVAYIGPAEGLPRDQWVLKSPAELLDLKICDPAMGSGAFLVQACRWLSERLVEAWSQVEMTGKTVNVDGEVQDTVVATEPLPRENEARLLIARRLIAERCLYGVDLNPLAVELAKLSIWLVTLAKGRPFGFLDHNLRSGDSLFGVHKLEQLTNFSLHPEKNQTISIFTSIIIQAIKEAIALRIKLRETPIRDIRDVQYMKQLAQNARNKLEQIDHIADAMFGEIIASSGQQRVLDAALVNLSTSAAAYITGDMEAGQEIIANARKLLSVDLPSGSLPRKPFHWVLEFPEVFESGGFDGVIGNPPFMGGRKMRSSLGDSYTKWLQTEWPHASLNSDFCAFFFLRAMVVLKAESNLGLLSTNTIAQGDTAKTGLSYLVNNYIATIRFANSSFIWPGKAIVMAALVIISKGKWDAPLVLNGSIVDYISPVLDDEAGWGEAVVFQQNKEINFQGSVLGGMGFVLTEKEAESYILNDSKNSEVIYPYLGGDDVNSHFEHKASRWAIDFRNYDLDFCERNWPELLNRIRRLVKPQRDLARRVAHKTYWWHHGDKRPALYGRIRGKDKVFVISRHTKYVAFVAVSTHHVFQESLCIVDLPSWSSFSMVQSSIHDLWVRRGSSTVGATLRYTPSDYFDTYPFLHIQTLELEEVGEKYHKTRNTLLIERNEGLTDIYNHLHDPENTDDDIIGLRLLHKTMDELVLQAYGWGDLDLAHGFYETNQGTRFTISADASRDVLKRLLNLNLKLHEDQTASIQDGKTIIQRQDKVQSQKTHQRKQK